MIFLLLGKLVKRGIPLPLIKDGFFALHHLFIKRKAAVGIVAFRIIIIDIIINYFFIFFIYICDKYLILYIIIYYIIVRKAIIR